jgi:hypothetical protein
VNIDVEVRQKPIAKKIVASYPNLFRWDRRQRTCWWWSWARRKILRCHVGLVVGKSGHCVVWVGSLVVLSGGKMVSNIVDGSVS